MIKFTTQDGAIDIRVAVDKNTIRMLDDAPDFGGEPGAGGVDPTKPLLSLVQQLEKASSLTFDDPEQFVDEVVEELLELPPEQRFEDGIKILEDQFIEEFGSLETFKAQFPLASVLFAFLEQLLNNWSEEIAERALEADLERRNGLLLVLGGVSLVQNSMDTIQADMQSEEEAGNLPPLELNKQEKYTVGSVFIAMYARLYKIIKQDQAGKEPSFTALAEDILYAEQALMEVIDPDMEYPSIADMTEEERAVAAIRKGAVKAYSHSDMSIGRGAELAQMTQEQFVALLEQSGMRPDYGPDSVEELHSGPDLMNE